MESIITKEYAERLTHLADTLNSVSYVDPAEDAAFTELEQLNKTKALSYFIVGDQVVIE
jgi:enolase